MHSSINFLSNSLSNSQNTKCIAGLITFKLGYNNVKSLLKWMNCLNYFKHRKHQLLIKCYKQKSSSVTFILSSNINNPWLAKRQADNKALSSLPSSWVSSWVVEVVPNFNHCQRAGMPTSSYKRGRRRSQWMGSTNPTNEWCSCRVHHHPRLLLAWLPTKPRTTFHARDQAFKTHPVSLSLLLTSQLSLRLQLGREGEDGKGGRRGLHMKHGHGGGNKG